MTTITSSTKKIKNVNPIHHPPPELKQPIFKIKPFDQLNPSTATIMCYSNIQFFYKRIFKNVFLSQVYVELTRKHKRVNRKKIKAPYGAIFSAQSGTEVRGVIIRKPRKKGKYFLNQATFDLSLGELPGTERSLNLNIMIFRNSLKIVGCKTIDDAQEAVMILWQNYILNSTNGREDPNDTEPFFKIPEGEQPTFVFETVMQNLDFDLGFRIDREALNIMMNSPQYKDTVFMSRFETTGNTNVAIRMFTSKPKNFKHEALILPFEGEPYREYYDTNPFTIPKEKKKKYITLLVFASSQTILSGKYPEEMKRVYEFFVNELTKNRKDVEEVIIKKSSIDSGAVENWWMNGKNAIEK